MSATAGTPPVLPGPGTGMSDDVRRAMLTRRVVLLHGALDDTIVAEAAATILMLDASGDERIVVRMTGTSSTIDAALVLMDVIDVAGVPVDTVGAGTIDGGAVGVLASGRHRSLAPHARLRLHEPDGSVAGRATDIERALAAQASQRDRFLARLSACTGRPLPHLVQEWGSGAFLEPGDAVALGYADQVEGGSPPGPRRAGASAGP
jgi:ATP-dependent Clp protease, protease subunit